MKLRIENNSIRFRLKQGEVVMLAETGLLESRLILGAGEFTYSLKASPAVAEVTASFHGGVLEIAAPQATVRRWANSSDVSIEAQPGGLLILIEKDFQCLHKDDSANADAFPNPLAPPR